MFEQQYPLFTSRVRGPCALAVATLASAVVLVACAPQQGSDSANGGWFSGQSRQASGAAVAPSYPPLTGQAARPSSVAPGYTPANAAANATAAYSNPANIPGGAVGGVAGFAVAHLGSRLTTTEGRSLYVFDRDPPGQSVCVGECARVWPPYLVEPGAVGGREYGIITRPDGRQQWAVGGRALYVYAGDQAPKQALGEGLDGTWHTVPYPVPAGFGQPVASSSPAIPPFPTSTEGLPIFQGSGSK